MRFQIGSSRNVSARSLLSTWNRNVVDAEPRHLPLIPLSRPLEGSLRVAAEQPAGKLGYTTPLCGSQSPELTLDDAEANVYLKWFG